MAKSRKKQKVSETDPNSSTDAAPPSPGTPTKDGWSPVVKCAISAWLMIHLLSMLAPPLDLATRRSGPAFHMLRGLSWYIRPAYLDHGYFFFAPDPGPSHLVRFRLQKENGESVEDMFPDKTKQWPRLLYHRHFMLSEHLHAAYTVPEFPADAPAEDRRQWQADRDLYASRWNGFERHLMSKHDGVRIEMHRVEHDVPDPLQFLDGMKLNDERLYRSLPETPPAPPTPGPNPPKGANNNTSINSLQGQGPLAPAAPTVPLGPAPGAGPLRPFSPSPPTALPPGSSPSDGLETLEPTGGDPE